MAAKEKGAAENGETETFCQGYNCSGCRQENKSCGMGMVVEYNMNTAVHVDRIRRKVEPRKRVMKHRRLFCEGVPVGLGDAITCFTTMDCGDRGCTGDFSKKNMFKHFFSQCKLVDMVCRMKSH